MSKRRVDSEAAIRRVEAVGSPEFQEVARLARIGLACAQAITATGWTPARKRGAKTKSAGRLPQTAGAPVGSSAQGGGLL